MAETAEATVLKSIAKKNEDFNQWYLDIIDVAQLCDKRYPIKGMNVWTGYGWGIMRQIDSHIRQLCDATGHQEVCFPLLIPETEFAKEKEHIKGFDDQVYWVTHAGKNKLDIRLCLRPTSETAMYPIFSLWIRSHNDLPLKTYQIVNTFRYETKQTRPFIRVREIHFFEAHTCHVSFEDAERQIAEDHKIMAEVARRLCMPYLIHRRPDWDKFAGAVYTDGVDALMPSGKVLQMGSIHQYKENFSRPYNISFEDADGKRKFVHQTTYGMSERLLGAVIGLHGDDKGLVLPPAIAPFEVVFVPVYSKGTAEGLLPKASEIVSMLEKEKIRVKYDNRDIRPGAKYYDWEIRGVPIRLEFGPKDMEKNQVVLVRRVDGLKKEVPVENLARTLKEELKVIMEMMYSNAKASLEGKTIHTELKEQNDIQKAKAFEGIVSTGWCGNEACAHKIEEKIDKRALGTPVNCPPEYPCPICSVKGPKMFFSQTY